MTPGPRTSAAEQDRQALLHALDALLAPMARAAAGPCPPPRAVLADILAQHQAMRHQRALLLNGPWWPLGPAVGEALQDAQQAAMRALSGLATAHHAHARLLASVSRYRVLLAHWPLVVKHPPTPWAARPSHGNPQPDSALTGPILRSALPASRSALCFDLSPCASPPST